MDIKQIDNLENGGDNYVVYSMYGFNIDKNNIFEIKNNQLYFYKKHDFLYAFKIYNDFKKIIFYLKNAFAPYEYYDKISLELERICFNLILYDDLSIDQLICILDHIAPKVKDIRFQDKLVLHEKICSKISIESNKFYKNIVEYQNDILNEQNYKIYRQIFDILQCKNLAVQYTSLYDLLKEQICKGKKQKQREVIKFFLNNKEKYPFVVFEKSRGCANLEEDYFTFLRNKIAHPWGLNSFDIQTLEISGTTIKYLLRIINDLICKK